jgi:hypothetical protein
VTGEDNGGRDMAKKKGRKNGGEEGEKKIGQKLVF